MPYAHKNRSHFNYSFKKRKKNACYHNVNDCADSRHYWRNEIKDKNKCVSSDIECGKRMYIKNLSSILSRLTIFRLIFKRSERFRLYTNCRFLLLFWIITARLSIIHQTIFFFFFFRKTSMIHFQVFPLIYFQCITHTFNLAFVVEAFLL